MEFAANSHIGLVRQINEDDYALHQNLGALHALLVADGMGGHLAGEIASSIAVEVVSREITNRLQGKTLEEAESNLGDTIVSAILLANEEIYRRGKTTSGYSGMGTTIVTSVVTPREIKMGYIGDSRGYLITPESITQLTDDHSLVNELYKSGQLTEEEANAHPQRNVLTRALGTDLEVEVDLVVAAWNPGDVLLLCTDGLTNLVSDDQIQQTLQQPLPLQVKVDNLIQMALDQGGTDNITIVAVQNTADQKEGEAQ